MSWWVIALIIFVVVLLLILALIVGYAAGKNEAEDQKAEHLEIVTGPPGPVGAMGMPGRAGVDGVDGKCEHADAVAELKSAVEDVRYRLTRVERKGGLSV